MAGKDPEKRTVNHRDNTAGAWRVTTSNNLGGWATHNAFVSSYIFELARLQNRMAINIFLKSDGLLILDYVSIRVYIDYWTRKILHFVVCYRDQGHGPRKNMVGRATLHRHVSLGVYSQNFCLWVWPLSFPSFPYLPPLPQIHLGAWGVL